MFPHYKQGFGDTPGIDDQSTSIYVVGEEGAVPVFAGAMVTPELTRQVVDALNGADLLANIGSAQTELEKLHDTLRRLKHVYAAAESAAATAHMINST